MLTHCVTGKASHQPDVSKMAPTANRQLQQKPTVRNACEECHERKIRCNIPTEGGSCINCQANERQCFFTPRFKSGRPANQSNKARPSAPISKEPVKPDSSGEADASLAPSNNTDAVMSCPGGNPATSGVDGYAATVSDLNGFEWPSSWDLDVDSMLIDQGAHPSTDLSSVPASARPGADLTCGKSPPPNSFSIDSGVPDPCPPPQPTPNFSISGIVQGDNAAGFPSSRADTPRNLFSQGSSGLAASLQASSLWPHELQVRKAEEDVAKPDITAFENLLDKCTKLERHCRTLKQNGLENKDDASTYTNKQLSAMLVCIDCSCSNISTIFGDPSYISEPSGTSNSGTSSDPSSPTALSSMPDVSLTDSLLGISTILKVFDLCHLLVQAKPRNVLNPDYVLLMKRLEFNMVQARVALVQIARKEQSLTQIAHASVRKAFQIDRNFKNMIENGQNPWG